MPRPASAHFTTPRNRGGLDSVTSAVIGLTREARNAGNIEPRIPAPVAPITESPIAIHDGWIPAGRKSENQRMSAQAIAIPNGMPINAPLIEIMNPRMICDRNSCRRSAPMSRAIANSRSCSASAVVIPVATITEHARKPMTAARTNAIRAPATWRSNPERILSVGSSTRGSSTSSPYCSSQSSESTSSSRMRLNTSIFRVPPTASINVVRASSTFGF